MGADLPPIPGVAPGHWWHDLRAVGASTFRGRTNERFIFYDGVVPLERSFETRGPAQAPSLRALGTETEVWVVDRSGYPEYEVRGDVPRRLGNGDAAALRGRLERELLERGLSAAEGRSLLDTWAPELLQVTDADPFPHATISYSHLTPPTTLMLPTTELRLIHI